MKVRALVVLAGLILGACNEQEPPPPPGSFDRPTRVAFVCFDKSEQPVALADCNLNASSGVDTSEFWLHALVVQSSRGEVAAVDMNRRQTLDSRPDIPGYTFLPVGELPTAITVPAQDLHSDYTYVANAGSRDITVLRTRAFRKLFADEPATAQVVPLPGGSRDAPQDMVLSPDEDALFVSIPDTGRLLRLPIQRCGEDCAEEGMIDAAGITELPLARSLERAVASPGGDVGHDAYASACFYERPIPNAAIPVAAPPKDSPAPRPHGLALDDFCETDKPCRRRLLVADAALPLIHVIDLEELAASGPDAAVQPPILTGAPTLSLAVTPRVPADTSPEAAETQYVYAIDARDGSVLVTENGKLLEVGTEDARRDRITLGAGVVLPHVLSLGVLTPAFDVHGPATQHTMESPSTEPPLVTSGQFCTDSYIQVYEPRRLRGVFLAIGASDGSVRIVDVHDMDVAECRHCEQGYKAGCVCNPGVKPASNVCEACESSWNPYPLIRHRTRIIWLPNQAPDRDIREPRLAPFATPYFTINSLLTQVRSNGTTSDPAIPGLDCVPCAEGQTPAFPAEVPNDTSGSSDDDAGTGEESEACVKGSARVCALAEPWANLEDWRAFYKGALPGAHGGQGHFDQVDSDTPEFRGESPFCSTGVLGKDALPGRSGDQLTILGVLPPDAIIRDSEPQLENADDVVAACKDLVERRDRSKDKIPIGFEIRAAYADRLELAPQLTSRPTGIDPAFKNDVEFVRKCFGNMLLSYEVRAGSGYVVLGVKKTGFEHHVTAQDGSGHCAQDPSADPKRGGRAYDGEPFDNGRVAFQITAGGAPQIDTILSTNLSPATVKAELSLSVTVDQQVVAALPVDIRWSGGDLNMYVVDVSYRGLVPLTVAPLQLSVTTYFQ